MVSAYHFTPASKTRGAPPASVWEVPRPEGDALSPNDPGGYLAARAHSPEVAGAAWVWTARGPGEALAAFANRRRRSPPSLVVAHLSPGAPVSRQFFRIAKGKGTVVRIETERGWAREADLSRYRRRGAREVVEARGGPPGGIRATGFDPTARVRGEGDR